MRTLFITILSSAFIISLHAQQPELTPAQQQQIESQFELSETGTEDDSWVRDLEHFVRHPLNINQCKEDELKQFPFLSPIQIDHFFRYRNLFGRFNSIYELQAIPGWDVETCQAIKPFITVQINGTDLSQLKSWFRNGLHHGELRLAQKIGESKNANAKFVGSPLRVFTRYTYRYKQKLQYGYTGEKDAGEMLMKRGFDFNSAHLFVRNMGLIKTIALGDFTVNMGQGLIQWQGLAFRKSADALLVKRQSDILRPYHSAGEHLFYRGAAISLENTKCQLTAFVSKRKLDANLEADSLLGLQVSTLLTSGYHRTNSELSDRKVTKQLSAGGSVKFRFKTFYAGINSVLHRFDIPFRKKKEPYNLYSFEGSKLQNTSFDYGGTIGNLHFFGELALNQNQARAFVQGFMISAGQKADISMVYRDIASNYQSLYSNAFTENTVPANERGVYIGMQLKPSSRVVLNLYADHFKNPWLRYRVDAPQGGFEYQINLNYRPGKTNRFFARYLVASRTLNQPGTELVMPALNFFVRKNLRIQTESQINPDLNIRMRVEYNQVKALAANADQGFLVLSDLIWKPRMKPYNFTARIAYIETDSYESRIYAYENDLPGSWSVPAFSGRFFRVYALIRRNLASKRTIWVRIAHSQSISGADSESEIKFYLSWIF